MATIGENLKRICNEKGISKSFVMEYSGLSTNAINNIWFNRGAKPSLTTIFALAKMLNVEPKELEPSLDIQNPQTTGKRFLKICYNRDLTIRELAKISGVSDMALYKFANDTVKPRLSTLHIIATVLEVDLEDLLPSA